VRIWDLREGYASECLQTLEPALEELYCCDWWQGSAHPRMFTVTSNVVDVWDMGTGQRHSRTALELVNSDGALPHALDRTKLGS